MNHRLFSRSHPGCHYVPQSGTRAPGAGPRARGTIMGVERILLLHVSPSDGGCLFTLLLRVAVLVILSVFCSQVFVRTDYCFFCWSNYEICLIGLFSFIYSLQNCVSIFIYNRLSAHRYWPSLLCNMVTYGLIENIGRYKMHITDLLPKIAKLWRHNHVCLPQKQHDRRISTLKNR